MIKINDIIYTLKNFPDGTYLLNNQLAVDANELIMITWQYENEAELSAIMMLTRYYQSHNHPVELKLPYVPNARMDRVKSTGEVFTLKYFCEFINWLNFRKVYVLDVHSNVAAALLDRVVVDAPNGLTRKVYYDCNPDVLFFPDEGAMKRYSGLQVSHLSPIAFGMKDRDWATGKIRGLDVFGADVKDKNVLIIDDICSRGGTFLHSARKLKELGAKDIYLCITHCENTILEGELLEGDLIKKVYTTDSIFTKEHEKIEVYNI